MSPNEIVACGGDCTAHCAFQLLLAATRAGVFAIAVRDDGAELRLELDTAFEGTDLRGPIGGPL